MERVHAGKERHRQRGRAYRVSFAAVAFGLIALGLLLIPLPGPGWLVVALGFGMLALEFDRAERMLDRILGGLERASEEAVGGSRVRAVVLGVAAVAAAAGAVAAALLWEVPLLPF
jgi:uncharacterized protein (TIGR02611 family)